jgi:hypothetical protein
MGNTYDETNQPFSRVFAKLEKVTVDPDELTITIVLRKESEGPLVIAGDKTAEMQGMDVAVTIAPMHRNFKNQFMKIGENPEVYNHFKD